MRAVQARKRRRIVGARRCLPHYPPTLHHHAAFYHTTRGAFFASGCTRNPARDAESREREICGVTTGSGVKNGGSKLACPLLLVDC